jgi:hypothetical protein
LKLLFGKQYEITNAQCMSVYVCDKHCSKRGMSTGVLDLDACIDDAAAAASTPRASAASAEDVAAKEEALQHNVFARRGCERLLKLLDTLLDVFPDNIKLSLYRSLFVSEYFGNSDNEQVAMQTWYNELKYEDGNPESPERDINLFQATRDGDAEALLDAKLGFLEAIDGHAIYAELLEDEREVLMDHLRRVNECAEMMVNMPPEIMGLVKSVVRGVDVSQPLAPATLVPLMQEALFTPVAGDDTDPTERLIGMSMQMMKLMQNGGLEALVGMMDPSAASGIMGSDGITGLLSSITREISTCQGIMTAGADDDTAAAATAGLLDLIGGGGRK